jgi:hypothetical protein
VQAILANQPPKGVKQLRYFLGMVQNFRDLWERWSSMLAPLTSLVGESAQTKVTKAKRTKKLPWHWDEVHQRAFDQVKASIAKKMSWPIQTIQKSLRFTQMLLANSSEQYILRITGVLCCSIGNSLLRNTNTVTPRLN